MRQIIDLLASKRLALFLFFSLAIFLIPETLLQANTSFYKLIKICLLSLFAANLLVCTVSRYKALRHHTLIIHLGCLVTIIGSMIGNFGYIATINLHPGISSDIAYRWDLEGDAPLGFSLEIKKINTEYYPVMVKIGVLENGNQAGLFQLQTGESFEFKGYTVETGSLDLEDRSLGLTIFKNNQLISQKKTTIALSDTDKEIESPFICKLVAFKTPTVKKTWVDIGVTQDGQETEGTTGVNQPFVWNGVRFFHTETGHDRYGAAYAGIQIVRDPGIAVVYLGFLCILLGCSLLLYEKNKPPKGKKSYANLD